MSHIEQLTPHEKIGLSCTVSRWDPNAQNPQELVTDSELLLVKSPHTKARRSNCSPQLTAQSGSKLSRDADCCKRYTNSAAFFSPRVDAFFSHAKNKHLEKIFSPKYFSAPW
jgi:hypothetical protein